MYSASVQEIKQLTSASHPNLQSWKLKIVVHSQASYNVGRFCHHQYSMIYPNSLSSRVNGHRIPPIHEFFTTSDPLPVSLRRKLALSVFSYQSGRPTRWFIQRKNLPLRLQACEWANALCPLCGSFKLELDLLVWGGGTVEDTKRGEKPTKSTSVGGLK